MQLNQYLFESGISPFSFQFYICNSVSSKSLLNVFQSLLVIFAAAWLSYVTYLYRRSSVVRRVKCLFNTDVLYIRQQCRVIRKRKLIWSKMITPRVLKQTSLSCTTTRTFVSYIFVINLAVHRRPHLNFILTFKPKKRWVGSLVLLTLGYFFYIYFGSFKQIQSHPFDTPLTSSHEINLHQSRQS